LCMAARPQNLDTLSIDPFTPPVRMHQGRAYDSQETMTSTSMSSWQSKPQRQPKNAKWQTNDSEATRSSTPRQPQQSQSSKPTAPDPDDLPLSSLAQSFSSLNPSGTQTPHGNMVYNPFVDNCDFENPLAQIPTGAGTLRGFEEPPTTLMIRNIPIKCAQEALLQEWPNNGTYDFFYLPCSGTLTSNKSYAFINFTSHKAACEFESRWDKNRLRNCRGRKSLNIGWASLQGLEANLCQLGKNWIWRQKVQGCQPLIFDKGELISIGEAFERLGLHNVDWSL